MTKEPKPRGQGRPVAYLTEKELAAAVERDERTLREWREQGCPHQRRSNRIMYRLPQVLEWLQERARKELDADESKERARKMRADADRSEMAAAKLRAELAPVAEMDAAVERLATAVRNEVSGLRSRYALQIIGLKDAIEAVEVLDRMAKQILAALASAAAGEDAGDADDDAPEMAA